MITVNIEAYAKACNVDPEDMIEHLQHDPVARQQFEEWMRKYQQDRFPEVHVIVRYFRNEFWAKEFVALFSRCRTIECFPTESGEWCVIVQGVEA